MGVCKGNQRREPAKLARQRHEAVVRRGETRERAQLADRVRQLGERVVVDEQVVERREQPEPRRQSHQLIVGDVEVPERGEHANGIWELDQLIAAENELPEAHPDISHAEVELAKLLIEKEGLEELVEAEERLLRAGGKRIATDGISNQQKLKVCDLLTQLYETLGKSEKAQYWKKRGEEFVEVKASRS